MKYKAIIKLNETNDSLRFIEANPNVNKDSLECVLFEPQQGTHYFEDVDNNNFNWRNAIVLIASPISYDFTIIMKKPSEEDNA